ncbi:protein NKG7-like [Saccostrea echinata]|uniref:protein NKG7-like n=1 Tax=Saccostrea echinata TaxID=191078 RepID=UPI002A7F4552|nr:protein NKG7-like [Saccostrea echinata]
MGKCLHIALVLTAVAVICQLIGLASPYWVAYESPSINAHSGLWKVCFEIIRTEKTECQDIETMEDWFKAVRAMSILGFLVLLVPVVLLLLKLFVLKEQKQLLLAAIGAAFAGALFILISIAVYSGKKNEMFASSISINFHFAFVFCIIGMLAAIGSGVVMLVEKSRD